MTKSKCVLIAALLLLPMSAQAEPYDMPVQSFRTVYTGLSNLDCLEKTVDPARGMLVCKEGSLRFKYSGSVRMTIARNIDAIRPIMERFERERNQVELLTRKAVRDRLVQAANVLPDEASRKAALAAADKAPVDLTPEGQEAITRVTEMLAAKDHADLMKLKLSDLEIDEGAKNAIPTSVLSDIYVLIEQK